MILAPKLRVSFLLFSMFSTCGQGRAGSIISTLSLYIAYSFVNVICLQVIQLYFV